MNKNSRFKQNRRYEGGQYKEKLADIGFLKSTSFIPISNWLYIIVLYPNSYSNTKCYLVTIISKQLYINGKYSKT